MKHAKLIERFFVCSICMLIVCAFTSCSSPKVKNVSPTKATRPPIQGPWTIPTTETAINQRLDSCPKDLVQNKLGDCCCPGDLACIDRGKEREELCGGDLMSPRCDQVPAKQPHAKQACTKTTNRPCSLTEQAVEKAFEEQKKDLHTCFESNNLGEVFVAGCIDSQGKPLHSSVHIKRNTQASESQALAQCVYAKMNALHFPTSQLGSSSFYIRLKRRNDELVLSSDSLSWGM